MTYRLVVFGEQPNEWFGRHRWITEEKILSIVRFPGSEVKLVDPENDPNTYKTRVVVNRNGGQVYLFIEYRDSQYERRVTFIHSQDMAHGELRR